VELHGPAPNYTNVIHNAAFVFWWTLRASTILAGVEEVECSNIVSVAERHGDLVWWEDEDQVTVIEGQHVFT